MLAFMLCTASLQAQSCTYYVSTKGTDFTTYSKKNPSRGETVASAFLSLQGAHNYIANNPAQASLGKQPITVCVESGDYYARDAAKGDGIQYPGSQADVLDISLSGGPNAVVTFTPDKGAHVTLHQTGWQAIDILPSAKYVAVSGFVVQGQSWKILATKDHGTNNLYYSANHRYANGKAQPWAFYDGNCIAATGKYTPGDNGGLPAGVPNHITIANNQIYACGGGGIAAIQTDYVTVTGNTIGDCSWYSIYGTSGISLLDSANSDADSTPGLPYKNLVTNNYLYGNAEYVPWTSYSPSPKITDGEAIIIDTNLNSSGTQKPTFPNGPIPAYAGRTLVANNVIWGNGSSAIEIFESEHVDVESNSTYKNDLNSAEPGRGEVAVSYASDVNVANNVFYGATPVSGGKLIQAKDAQGNLQAGRAWFQNNVYYAGTGVEVSAPNKIKGFYEGVGEQTLDPGYVNTTAAGWPPRPNLRVAHSTAAANGCANGRTICFAPANDILGFPRTYPYASGAYATTSQ